MEVWALLLLIPLFLDMTHGTTNDQDVYALNVFFSSLTSPSLPGWTAVGGDPCSDHWKGVTCIGPNVTQLNLSGLGLMGRLGYALDRLSALTLLDISNNNLAGDIPFQLPPNIEHLVLSNNQLTGVPPYSLIYLNKLALVNVSNNLLSGTLPDVFDQSKTLTHLDLSHNNLTGSLPSSMGTLASLNTLYLNSNHLNGTINVLAGLPLKDLDISYNNFSGTIPTLMASITTFRYTGNYFKLTPGVFPLYFSPPPAYVANFNTSIDRGISQAGDGSKRSLTAGHIAGIAIAAVLTAVIAVLVTLFFVWRTTEAASNTRRMTDVKPQTAPETAALQAYATLRYGSPKEKTVDGDRAKNSIPVPSYTLGELQIATNSFSQENLIGEGTSARVYKAKFPNGKILAIKKLDSSIVIVHEKDFLEVLTSISRLRHTNIAELVGFCTEHGQRILVYEYINNGTLHEALHFSEEKSKRLSWNHRIKIALGAARALEYLHEICQPTVVHRNFKSSNILLDEDFNPRLSDCGLVSLTSFGSQCQFSAQHMGSFGYSAPEFAMSGLYSAKSDVYSFGVVMLELLTGRKPLDSSRPRAEQSLVRWTSPQLHDIDALSKIVDPALKGIYPAKSLSRFADVISLCVQPEPEFRPAMSEVTQSLVRLLQRASIHKRRSGEELGSSQRILDTRQDFGET